MRVFIVICILLSTFHSELFANGSKKALGENPTPKTTPGKISTIFSQVIDEALPDLKKGNYLAGYKKLSELKGPFDTSKMALHEITDYGNYIHALAMCEAVFLPSNKNEAHAKRLASNMLTAAEILEQVGDPKFFIVKYFLQRQGLSDLIMRKILYPKQLQGNFSKFLDDQEKARLKALIKKVEAKNRLKSKL